jgi:hypothetical protein
MGLLEQSDLLAQSQVLERKISATPKDGSERTDEDCKPLEHSQKANGARRKLAIESSRTNYWYAHADETGLSQVEKLLSRAVPAAGRRLISNSHPTGQAPVGID